MQSGERSAKESPLSVVFYEIHMLNHAATYLEPEILDRKDHIANAWQEVYLLHYRNLIEFFSSHKPRTRKPHQSILDAADDMTYLRPLTWAGRDIQEDELRPAVERGDDLHANHFDPISRYLQHCTDWRHELPKEWGYPTMHRKMTEVLEMMYTVMARHGIDKPPPMR